MEIYFKRMLNPAPEVVSGSVASEFNGKIDFQLVSHAFMMGILIYICV